MFLFVGAGLFAMFLFLTYYFQFNLGLQPAEVGVRVPPVQRWASSSAPAWSRSCFHASAHGR